MLCIGDCVLVIGLLHLAVWVWADVRFWMVLRLWIGGLMVCWFALGVCLIVQICVVGLCYV